MLSRWFKNETWPIGCAIGERSVRLLQVQPRRGGGVDIATAKQPIMPSQEASRQSDPWCCAATDALRRALAAGRMVGRNTVSCLSPKQVHYRHLRLAPMPDDELAAAVQWRASKELEGRVERVRADYFDVGAVTESGKRRREVVAVAASGSDIDAHVALLEAAGLAPIAIDASAAALARCLLQEGSGGEGSGAEDGAASAPILILEITAMHTNLLIAQAGLPRLIRSLSGGFSRILELAGDRHGLDAVAPDDLLRSMECGGEVDAVVAGALEEAAALYASELSHAVSVCLHHLNQARLGAFKAEIGCVIGAGMLHRALLKALGRASSVEFFPVDELLNQQVRRLLAAAGQEGAPADGGGDPDAWLLPMGLALYGREHILEGVAA